MSALPRVGFVGAGVMGLPMARRLLSAGYPISVHARTPAKVAALTDAGATLADTPAQLAAASDVLVGCLLDEKAVHAIYHGSDGLFAGIRAGHLLVEHGTLAPRVARALAARASELDAGFLDIPVTGGPRRAHEGRLTGMAGGQPEHLDTVRPLVGTYCSELLHLGPSGAGLQIKMVNQLLVSVHVAAAAEAAALLGRLGLDAARAKTVLMSGWAAGAMLDYCLPAALTPSTAPSGATIGGLLPVQEQVAEALAEVDLDAPVFHTAHQVFAALAGSGGSALDLAQLARAYDRDSPVTGPGRHGVPGSGVLSPAATSAVRR
ncbi:NAD(P)-dependent oxidoreductase [Streptomyces sp. NPDC056835]|uniref:NAD(P)-dependent oxidoreductase n=1 Tax=Streptomyces sp. NPDC056835 TaxID=3345956 RepID=UPI00368B5978